MAGSRIPWRTRIPATIISTLDNQACSSVAHMAIVTEGVASREDQR
jgi:hypothetical protein